MWLWCRPSVVQESGEWQEKYRLLLLQAGDAAKLREQYAKLESQYNALALVVGSSPEASQAAEVDTLLTFLQHVVAILTVAEENYWWRAVNRDALADVRKTFSC